MKKYNVPFILPPFILPEKVQCPLYSSDFHRNSLVSRPRVLRPAGAERQQSETHVHIVCRGRCPGNRQRRRQVPHTQSPCGMKDRGVPGWAQTVTMLHTIYVPSGELAGEAQSRELAGRGPLRPQQHLTERPRPSACRRVARPWVCLTGRCTRHQFISAHTWPAPPRWAST
jgi:hypothetical protein